MCLCIHWIRFLLPVDWLFVLFCSILTIFNLIFAFIEAYIQQDVLNYDFSEGHTEDVPACHATHEMSVDVAVELKSITADKEEQGAKFVEAAFSQWSIVAHSWP